MFFWELASLIDIMLIGHWIEMKSVMGASRALEELAKLMPSDAHKLMPDGSVKDVPLGELAVDDKVLIKPGEKVPADGVIVAGESSVDEAMLTGESTPVAKKTGGKVIGGAINGEGSLTIAVKGTGKDSFLSQVIDLVKQAQESKTETQATAATTTTNHRKRNDHERSDHIHDQRPCVRNDRGPSEGSPRRARGEDVLLLRRALSGKVLVHPGRCQTGEQVWRLL